jgi:hypothetical protein
VRSGLVASLTRPGGNTTGINFFTQEVAAKRFLLLRELVPKPSGSQFLSIRPVSRIPNRRCRLEGGLISPDLISMWRGAASYVDRILRGEKPADLPVQLPVKYETVLNMKTAKALKWPVERNGAELDRGAACGGCARRTSIADRKQPARRAYKRGKEILVPWRRHAGNLLGRCTPIVFAMRKGAPDRLRSHAGLGRSACGRSCHPFTIDRSPG